MLTITTYEKHSTAFNVLQYGFDPIIEAYRIKDYDLRRVDSISTHSLRRLERLVKSCRTSRSDCSEHWFKVVHTYQEKFTMHKNDSFVIYPNGKIRKTANALVYVRNIMASWNNTYCQRITIQALPDGKATVIYSISDGRTVFSTWADLSVALDYFTNRARTLSGVPITVIDNGMVLTHYHVTNNTYYWQASDGVHFAVDPDYKTAVALLS